MFNATLWILKTGAPWRDLPKEFGNWQMVYKHFNYCAKSERLQEIFEVLSVNAELDFIALNSTSIKVHKHGCAPKCGQKKGIGRSRGGIASKIHAITDSLGLPLKMLLTWGNTHNSVPACSMIDTFFADAFLADKAYGSKEILEKLKKTISCL